MGLMKKLTSAIVASSLVLSLVGTAFAAYTPAAGETAGNRMQTLGMIQGKPDLGLDLNGEITRAELVTVIVRAFGQEDNAKLLVGAAAYPDTSSHWASGNIAMAKALIEKQGESMGMPDGTFAPDAKLTPAQAVAFLMKFLGVKADAAKAWPANFLDSAVAANIITAEDNALIAPMLNSNATRGLVFYLFDRAFYTYDLGAGKTFYTKYVDMTAPVITLTAVEPTIDSKATITGKADGATEVYVGTTKVSFDAAGNFSHDYELVMGENPITVTAIDLAGNAVEKSLTVTRTVGDVATIEAAAITVAAGATVDVAAAAKDIKGNTVETAITGESTVGTFADGKFTAGKVAGTGILTLKAGEKSADVAVTVTAGPLAAVTASATSVQKGDKVTLTGTDANGNTVSGVTYTVDNADGFITNGVFVGTAIGSYTITGTANGQSATLTVGVYGDAYKVAIISAPETLIGNDATYKTVKVAVVDKNGNVAADAADVVVLTPSAGLTVLKADGTAFTGATELAAEKGIATFAVKATNGFEGTELTLTATPKVAFTGTHTQSSTKVVTTYAQAATSIKVSAPTYLPNGGGAKNVAVSVLDQEGKAMLAGSGYWPLTVAVSGPATLPTNTTWTYSGGTATDIAVTPKTGYTGDVTVTVTIDGLGTKSATLKNVYPTAATTVKVSLKDDKASAAVDKSANTLTVNFELLDANGVPVNAASAIDLAVTAKDAAGEEIDLTGTGYTTTGLTTGNVTIASGANTASLVIGSDVAGVMNLTFANSSYTITGGATLTYQAGDATQVALARYNTIQIPVADPKASLSAQLYDAFGNKVAKAGVGVTFTATGSNAAEVTIEGTATEYVAKTDANGVATVNLVTRPFGGSSYTVEVSGTDALTLTALTTDEGNVTVSVQNQVASKVEVSVVRADNGLKFSSITAGSQVFLRVVVKDQYGAVLSSEALNLALNSDKVLADANDDLVKTLPAGAAFAYNSTDKRYEVQVTGTETALVLGKAGAVTLGVKNTAGQTEIAGSATVVVNADRDAAQAEVKVVEANTSNQISAKKGAVSGPFTVQLTDRFGNNISVAAPVEITFAPADAELSVRGSVDGVTMATANITATKAFYVAVDSSAVVDDVLVLNFTDAGGNIGTVNVKVTK